MIKISDFIENYQEFWESLLHEVPNRIKIKELSEILVSARKQIEKDFRLLDKLHDADKEYVKIYAIFLK